ncbi:bifunctional phosphoribosyl-AMP cyclohydrolase/phosphoribosyl-ATP diphosphatase HisIE [Cytophaga aurantiaca]|uniref:bifunctional phosphoribosyl-AMP cyclohydrolase/phosphoribosyl-ATP diphosphatase HisIE n=1 Tax=Cytophaga aurantiaca TaxID=29530 RepID=UPI00037439F5|nr:bifunctional phosphoribosyl-AMP cyclohydrolase/phosphoribosyl-ATP diphosphatase HisIE [Cytophaga aurantiaca]
MNIDFQKGNGLVPVIIQDATTRNVLMLGYMNEEAYTKTKAEGKVTFFSRTKNRLWTKGETTGNFLNVVDIKLDCDQDTLLIKVTPDGPTCHKGDDTCWAEVNNGRTFFIEKLASVIKDRKNNPTDASYTASLFRKGINKVAQKVGEEAVEIVIEAKDNNDDLFKGEAADLLYHYLILLEAKNIPLDDVIKVLESRQK